MSTIIKEGMSSATIDNTPKVRVIPPRKKICTCNSPKG